MKSREE